MILNKLAFILLTQCDLLWTKIVLICQNTSYHIIFYLILSSNQNKHLAKEFFSFEKNRNQTNSIWKKKPHPSKHFSKQTSRSPLLHFKLCFLTNKMVSIAKKWITCICWLCTSNQQKSQQRCLPLTCANYWYFSIECMYKSWFFFCVHCMKFPQSKPV